MKMTARRSTVPGHAMWRARVVRGRRGSGAVRARHRLWAWQTITVDTRDLRYGYEAIARYLSGGHVGYRVRDNRRLAGRLARAGRSLRPARS